MISDHDEDKMISDHDEDKMISDLEESDEDDVPADLKSHVELLKEAIEIDTISDNIHPSENKYLMKVIKEMSRHIILMNHASKSDIAALKELFAYLQGGDEFKAIHEYLLKGEFHDLVFLPMGLNKTIKEAFKLHLESNGIEVRRCVKRKGPDDPHDRPLKMPAAAKTVKHALLGKFKTKKLRDIDEVIVEWNKYVKRLSNEDQQNIVQSGFELPGAGFELPDAGSGSGSDSGSDEEAPTAVYFAECSAINDKLINGLAEIIWMSFQLEYKESPSSIVKGNEGQELKIEIENADEDLTGWIKKVFKHPKDLLSDNAVIKLVQQITGNCFERKAYHTIVDTLMNRISTCISGGNEQQKKVFACKIAMDYAWVLFVTFNGFKVNGALDEMTTVMLVSLVPAYETPAGLRYACNYTNKFIDGMHRDSLSFITNAGSMVSKLEAVKEKYGL